MIGIRLVDDRYTAFCWGKNTSYHLRIRHGNDAQREVRDRDERSGRVDERYEIVKGFEIYDRRRDLNLRRVIHVQPK